MISAMMPDNERKKQMKKLFGLMLAIVFSASVASAATVPTALKSKIANDVQLSQVRGTAGISIEIDVPVAYYLGNNTWYLIRWIYIKPGSNPVVTTSAADYHPTFSGPPASVAQQIQLDTIVKINGVQIRP